MPTIYHTVDVDDVRYKQERSAPESDRDHRWHGSVADDLPPGRQYVKALIVTMWRNVSGWSAGWAEGVEAQPLQGQRQVLRWLGHAASETSAPRVERPQVVVSQTWNRSLGVRGWRLCMFL